MANKQHIEILKQGVGTWNTGREENPDVVPDLTGAKLNRASLTRLNLSFAKLSAARLNGATLRSADLRGADLRCASLKYANFNPIIYKGLGASTRTNLSEADFSNADLRNAKLSEVLLTKAKLEGANLKYAILTNAELGFANLRGATLDDADLGSADLSNASLSDAQLFSTDLTGAVLNGTDFTAANIGWTIFGDTDLSQLKGLDNAKHAGPSIVGINTIYRSAGRISETFLKRAGIPDNFITYMSSLVLQPVEFYSCFISYSSPDQNFVERLYSDLQNEDIRCWYAAEDLKIGEEIRTRIDESIRMHDKLLLVLSEQSIKSQWVEQEVETALAKEREQSRMVLFPIRLDDAVMGIPTGWPAFIKNTRNIGDFRNWEDHDSYQKAFHRLMRDLKAKEASESRV